jgi:hypothetical protein
VQVCRETPEGIGKDAAPHLGIGSKREVGAVLFNGG